MVFYWYDHADVLPKRKKKKKASKKFCSWLSSFDICCAVLLIYICAWELRFTLKRTLTEKDFLSSMMYSLDCFLCLERGSCLINSLLVFVPKIVAISIFCPHLSLCQQVGSGGLGFLTVMDLLCDSQSSLEQLFL